jgi:hypothetical protein
MRTLRNLNQAKSIQFFIFLPFTFISFIAAGRTYAKTDDYVFFGMVKADNLTWVKSLDLFVTSPWNAGRWISSASISTIYFLVPNVDALRFIRILSVLLILMLAYSVYWVIKEVTGSTSLGVVSQLILISLPGVHSFITLVGSITYILATGFGVMGSYFLFLYFKSGKMIYFLHSTILGLFACFTYQPATFLLCTCVLIGVGRSVIFFKDKLVILIILISQPFLILVSNSVLINMVGSSGRNTLQIPDFEKFKYYFKFIFGTVLVPWVRLENPVHYGALMAIVICVISVYLTMQFGVFNSTAKKLSKKIPESILKILVVLGGLPLTNSWVLLLEERHLDFRRYFFSSLTYYLIIFCTLQYAFAHRNVKLIQIIKFLSVTTLVLLSLFTLKSNLITSEILEKEWQAYVCASKAVSIGENVKIDRSLVLAQNFTESPDEDFNTMSSYYPNPPSFLLWLSQKQSREVNFLPWNMNLSDNAEEVSSSVDGIRWGESFKACTLGDRR